MKLNLKAKMIVSMFIIIVIPISTLGVLTYQKSKEVLVDDLKNYNNNIIVSNLYFINKSIFKAENNIKFWVSDPSIQSYPGNRSAGTHVEKQWEKFVEQNVDIMSIYFGTSDGKFYMEPKAEAPIGTDPRSQGWYKRAIEINGGVVWNPPIKSPQTGEMISTISCLVKNEASGKIIGVIGIDYNMREISESMQLQNLKFLNEGYKFIIDQKGEVLAHSNWNLIGTDLSTVKWIKNIMNIQSGTEIIETTDGKYLLNFATIGETGWKIVNMLPMSVVQRVVVPIRNRTIMIAVISCLLALLAGYLLSRYITRRIASITRYMEEVEKGNSAVLGYYDGDDLFGELNKKFNVMAININQRMNAIKHMANTDGLTGLYNHKYIYEKLEEEINRLKRFDNELSIIMIDIDFFKAINDKFGHQVGDRALILVVKAIKSNIRDIDTVGRYGGEEFLIIMPGCDGDEALIAAERIRKSIEEIEWEYKEVRLTISLGVKEYKNENAHQMIEAADKLLYKSKARGRNRTEI